MLLRADRIVLAVFLLLASTQLVVGGVARRSPESPGGLSLLSKRKVTKTPTKPVTPKAASTKSSTVTPSVSRKDPVRTPKSNDAPINKANAKSPSISGASKALPARNKPASPSTGRQVKPVDYGNTLPESKVKAPASTSKPSKIPVKSQTNGARKPPASKQAATSSTSKQVKPANSGSTSPASKAKAHTPTSKPSKIPVESQTNGATKSLASKQPSMSSTSRQKPSRQDSQQAQPTSPQGKQSFPQVKSKSKTEANNLPKNGATKALPTGNAPPSTKDTPSGSTAAKKQSTQSTVKKGAKSQDASPSKEVPRNKPKLKLDTKVATSKQTGDPKTEGSPRDMDPPPSERGTKRRKDTLSGDDPRKRPEKDDSQPPGKGPGKGGDGAGGNGPGKGGGNGPGKGGDGSPSSPGSPGGNGGSGWDASKGVLGTPHPDVGKPRSPSSPKDLPMNPDGTVNKDTAFVKHNGGEFGKLNEQQFSGNAMPSYGRTFKTPPEPKLTGDQVRELSRTGNLQAAQHYNSKNPRQPGDRDYLAKDGPRAVQARYDPANNLVAIGSNPKKTDLAAGHNFQGGKMPPPLKEHFRDSMGIEATAANKDLHAEHNTATQLHGQTGRLPTDTQIATTYRPNVRQDGGARPIAACSGGSRNCRNAEDALRTQDLNETPAFAGPDARDPRQVEADRDRAAQRKQQNRQNRLAGPMDAFVARPSRKRKRSLARRAVASEQRAVRRRRAAAGWGF